MSWADIQVSAAARWLNGVVGSATHFAIGITNEALANMLLQGIQARYPSEDQPDALAPIGRDRNLDRGPNEPAAAFAARCRAAFQTWSSVGHPRELLTTVLAYLTPNAPIVRVIADLSIWDTLAAGAWSKFYASPTNWNWDGRTQWWRAWVVIFAPSFGPAPTWGSFTYGDGTCWGTGANATQVQALRNLVKKWKPANVVIPNIIVTQDASQFDPTQPAGGGINPDGLYGLPYKMTVDGAVAAGPADTAFFGGVS